MLSGSVCELTRRAGAGGSAGWPRGGFRVYQSRPARGSTASTAIADKTAAKAGHHVHAECDAGGGAQDRDAWPEQREGSEDKGRREVRSRR